MPRKWYPSRHREPVAMCGGGRTVQTAIFAGSIGLQSCNRWPRV